MKKYLLPLAAACLMVAACTDKEPPPGPDPGPDPEPGQEENPYETGIDKSCVTFTEWDSGDLYEYLFLGYGYDMTGKYAHPVSVRKKIFDVHRYEEELGGGVYIMKGTSSSAENIFNGTREESSRRLAYFAGFTDGEISRYKNLFRDIFTGCFDNDEIFPDLHYYYCGYSGMWQLYRMNFWWSRWNYKDKYLTNEFHSDLETLPAAEIIEFYGTHMITGLKAGIRVDNIYRTTCADQYRRYEWMNYNVERYRDTGNLASIPRPDGDAPLKDNIYFEVVDASGHNPNGWMIDILNYEGGKVEILRDGMPEENSTMIDFDGMPVPIYMLVMDPGKRAEIEEAFEIYLGASH